MKKELVLCVEKAALKRHFAKTGLFSVADWSPLAKLPGWFCPRSKVEDWDHFVQLIPYVILESQDGVVVYRRTQKAGDARLREKWSLGFGGHASIGDAVLDGDDVNIDATLQRCARRELDEEIELPSVVERHRVGMILVDDNPVSRVHAGIVERWVIEPGRLRPRDETVAECQRVLRTALPSWSNRLETWSQLCATWLVDGDRRR